MEGNHGYAGFVRQKPITVRVQEKIYKNTNYFIMIFKLRIIDFLHGNFLLYHIYCYMYPTWVLLSGFTLLFLLLFFCRGHKTAQIYRSNNTATPKFIG